jgi:hypothetical protein
MADTEVFGMTISVGWNVARDWPFAVAEAKLAVPKLVSGRMPPLAVNGSFPPPVPCFQPTPGIPGQRA